MSRSALRACPALRCVRTSAALRCFALFTFKTKETIRTTTRMMVFLGPRGGRKRAVPADTVDTLSGGRKGDPRHKVVGKTVGGEDSKYRRVLKFGVQKNSLY